MGKGLPYSHKRGPHVEQGITKLRIEVDDVVVVSATAAAIGWGTGVLQGLPEGNLMFLGAIANVNFAGSGADANLVDTWSGDFGVGTTPADDATITAADVDLIPSTAIGAATAEVIATVRAESTANGVFFNNTDGSLEVNFNLLIDAADITDDESVNITVKGVVTLSMVVIEDD